MDQKRIRHACARCRRQKLKCDNIRPCPLCVHANVECKEATERTRRSNRIPRQSPLVHTRAGPCDQTRRTVNITTPPFTDGRCSRSGSELEYQNVPSSSQLSTERADTSPQERSSAIHLVNSIFKKYHYAGGSKSRLVDAIPDGSALGHADSYDCETTVPVQDLIGLSLPSPLLTHALIDIYMKSMHWYLTLFHEPTLRARLAPILATGHASSHERSFLLLVIMVIVTAIRSTTSEEREQLGSLNKLRHLELEIQKAAERWFLPSIEENSTDSLGFTFLMASNYLMIRRTRAAYFTMSTTIRSALSINLNDESAWGDLLPVDREIRSRLWWTLVIAAGFIAMSFGKPPLLKEVDCSGVRLPLDLDDTSSTCPGFDSSEQRDDGNYMPVTIGSYNRYKAKLYVIAIAITHDIYFSRNRTAEDLIRSIERFHERLLDWEREVPRELRPTSHSDRTVDGPDSAILQRFTMQATTLQVSYDNVHLFLFRPLLSLQKPSPGLRDSQNIALPSPVSGQMANSTVDLSHISEVAQNQCWVSAIRTSQICQDLKSLSLLKSTPACPHIGVHAFTAGVILGLLALSEPLSARSQSSKHGIARLIQIPRKVTFEAPIWTQLTSVLTDLMHVIGTEETNALVSGQAIGVIDANLIPTNFGEPLGFSSNVVTEIHRTVSQPLAHTTQGVSVAETSAHQLGLQRPGYAASSDPSCESHTTNSRHPPSWNAQYAPNISQDLTDLEGLAQFGFDNAQMSRFSEILGDSLHGLDQTWLWDTGSFRSL